MELVDRDIHLQELDAAWQNATSEGCFILVYGEAGIGKTALVEQFVNRQKGHVRLLWGACDDLFTPRPLGPLHDLAGQAQGQLPRLLQAKASRPLIFSACLQELQTQPTIVVIEDIHWADEATLDLLKYLGRRIHLTPSLLVVTYRDDELNPQHPLRLLLGDLATSPAWRRIALTPLSLEGVHRLIGERPVDAKSLHRQTGGNPFYVTEVLATEKEGVPPTVRDAVLARAARLSLSGRAVLNAAAVIGTRVAPWLLAEVTRAEAEAVDESLALGILLAQGENFIFRHELVRQTILDTIPPHQRVFLHQAVLDALKATPTGQKQLARLAHHAEAANDRKAIVAYAPAAGKAAAALGMHHAAAALFALALPYVEDLPLLEQIELHEAYALCMQSEPGRTTTMAAYRRAAALSREAGLPQREGFNLARLSGALSMVDELAESDRILDQALTILEPLGPNRALVTAYTNQALKHLKRGENEAAIAVAEKSYQIAQKTGEVHVILDSFQMLGLCWLPLDHSRGCEHLEKCLAMALESKQYWVAGMVYPNLSMTYVDVYKLARAEQLIHEGISFTVDHDMDMAKDVLQAWQAVIHLYLGRWNEAGKGASELLRRSTTHPYAQTPARLALGRLLARRGESGAAEMLDKALNGLHRSDNRQRFGSAYTARAEAAWLAGDRKRTVAEARTIYDFTVQNKQPGFAAELAYWRWRAGGDVETFDWMVQPFVLEILGNWRGAAAAWKALGCPYEQARALADGDSEAQKASLVIFEQLGARPMADVVRQKLRAAGVQTLPRGPRATTKENPFNLTNRQVEVLALLTDNLTNAEIAARLHISPKTVDHHVSAVLAKLDVSSREEAAVLARQHPNF